MEIERIRHIVESVMTPGGPNYVSPSDALVPDVSEMRMYESVHIGVAAADHPYFDECRKEAVVGAHFKKPDEWLPGARSVVAFFFNFTERVTASNIAGQKPSPEWLHARIEGQKFIARAMLLLKEEMEASGHRAVVPSSDARFRSVSGTDKTNAFAGKLFTSVWSERHAAHACGLGTFGLTRGLITKHGMTGRFSSIVTDLALAPTPGDYRSYADYCSMCGACIARCPAHAISIDGGKDQWKCSAYVDRMMKEFSPRYGCGKCQVGVPCETRAPVRMS